MPKRKDFLKESKKSKHSPSVPNTADEYLAAGVDFEEAGEKWRGGDAAKSARFFVRAIDLYDEALKKFPKSFDLAYNKARVQYEFTQHPKLLALLPGTLSEVLHTALESSRLALSLKRDNPDVLFNTAQCLTSLVEASSDQDPEQEFKCLEEAIELFQQCLSIQELNYEESQAQMQAHPDVEDQSSSGMIEASSAMNADEESSEGKSMVEDQWATIIEPITVESLLDTLTALLETLTAFCNLLSSHPSPSPKTLPMIQGLSSNLLNTKLPAYLSISSDPVPAERTNEVLITRATFLAALADTTLRSDAIDIPTYARTIEEAFSYDSLSTTLSSNPEGLCNKAESLITFSQSLRIISLLPSKEEQQLIPAARWKALTTAIASLTAASKLPNAENLVKIHLARGDIELYRYRLGRSSGEGEAYAPAAKNGSTLLKNAATYYRGAAALARSDVVSWEEELREAVVKEGVANELAERGSLDGMVGKLGKEEERVVGDMVDEGLVIF